MPYLLLQECMCEASTHDNTVGYWLVSAPVSLADTCSAAFSTDLKASSAPDKLHLSGCTILTSRLTAALMLLASAPGCRSSTCKIQHPSYL